MIDFKDEEEVKAYEEIINNYPIHTYASQHMYKVVDSISFHLDIGGGTGLATEELNPLCETQVILDSSKEMLRVAKENERADYFIQGDAETANNLLDQEVDLITMNYAMHYFENPLNVIDSSYRLLADEGVLLMEDSSKEDWHSGSLYQEFLNDKLEISGGSSELFSSEEIIKKSDFDSFEVITEEYELNGDDLIYLLAGTLVFSGEAASESVTESKKWLEERGYLEKDERLCFDHHLIFTKK